MSTKSILTGKVLGIALSAVVDTRKELRAKYKDIDTKDSEHYNFTGLCDEAVDIFAKYVKEYGYEFGVNIYVYIIHGEQRHNPAIPSKYWILQHTWCYMQIKSIRVYVDPTSSQFKWLYNDIPNYYVSTSPPKWYYPDRKNCAFSGLTSKLNKKFRIDYETEILGDKIRVNEGLIEFCQYEIYGRISDALRKMIKK